MANPGNCCDSCSKLKVGRYDQGKLVWDEILPPLNRFKEVIVPDGHRFSIVVAKTADFKHCTLCRPVFTEFFQIPDVWWADWMRGSVGHFDNLNTFDDKDDLDGLTTWHRFAVKDVEISNQNDMSSPYHHRGKHSQVTYTWRETHLLTRWMMNTKSTVSLILDEVHTITAKKIEAKLEDRLIGHQYPVTSPYYLYTLITEISLEKHHDAILRLHWVLRDTAKGRYIYLKPLDLEVIYERLRHIQHGIEMLKRNIEMARGMLAAHNQWIEDMRNPLLRAAGRETDQLSAANNNLIASRLTNNINALQQLLERARAVQDAMRDELQVANTRSSIEIATTAAADADTMKWLAILGAIFLPGTFIAAIFSMSFFNTDSNGEWYLHSNFWIYWAFAIPFSVIALTMIFLRGQVFNSRQRS